MDIDMKQLEQDLEEMFDTKEYIYAVHDGSLQLLGVGDFTKEHISELLERYIREMIIAKDFKIIKNVISGKVYTVEELLKLRR